MQSTILVYQFDIMPSSQKYSELYSKMIVVMESDCIVTTYHHRSCKSLNRVIVVPLNVLALK